ncbi:MAG: YceI family protein [Bacteroidota bacterium]
MNKLFFPIVAVLVTLTAFRFHANYANKNESIKTYTLSTEESKLQWKGYWISPKKEDESVSSNNESSRYPEMKVSKHHRGTVSLTKGVLKYHNKSHQLGAGKFTVDLTSISSSDLEGKTKEKLEGHLKSPDFFHVSEYAQAQVTLTDIKTDAAQITIELMGLKLEETIPVTTLINGGKMTLRGEFSIDMSPLDLKMMSPHPEKPEDGHIDPIVDFTIEATLKEKQ